MNFEYWGSRNQGHSVLVFECEQDNIEVADLVFVLATDFPDPSKHSYISVTVGESKYDLGEEAKAQESRISPDQRHTEHLFSKSLLETRYGAF